ncbi:hypothetical protein [Rubrivirga sp.]|uniref:hypothetical protein n=1 Tax=Rubrivirga sp. TaxID=1885344 RepID=UPI003B51C085
MKLQRVYTDTSVIGGCFDAEFAKWSNALVRDYQFERLRLVLSDVVALEVVGAPEQGREKYAELLAYRPEVLTTSPEAIELAARYQARGILTPKYATDGLHIALATVAGVDVLVSWNFRHIVHFDKIRLFNAVNLEAGYKPISIHSPREVTTDPETDEDS